MSGGAWDYDQYKLEYIIDSIEDKILKNKERPEYWFGAWEGQVYSDETIEKFKEAIAYLKIALCYAQRLDWLISGDDGEESFHRRLKTDLEKLVEYDTTGYVKKNLEM